MRKLIITVLLAAVGVSACGGQDPTVPNVVGMNPQEAITAIHDAGIEHTTSHGGIGAQEGTGYAVCRTEPAVGDTASGKVNIYSRKDCEATSDQAKADVSQAKAADRAEARTQARASRAMTILTRMQNRNDAIMNAANDGQTAAAIGDVSSLCRAAARVKSLVPRQNHDLNRLRKYRDIDADAFSKLEDSQSDMTTMLGVVNTAAGSVC